MQEKKAETILEIGLNARELLEKPPLQPLHIQGPGGSEGSNREQIIPWSSLDPQRRGSREK